MEGQNLNKLSEEQKWHLEKEGLEARVRNQLGPFTSLLKLIRLYKDINGEDQRGKLFNIIQSTYKASFDSIIHLRFLAKETNNQQLGNAIEKLQPLVESIKNFVEDSDNIIKIDLIINDQEKYEAAIVEAIDFSKE